MRVRSTQTASWQPTLASSRVPSTSWFGLSKLESSPNTYIYFSAGLHGVWWRACHCNPVGYRFVIGGCKICRPFRRCAHAMDASIHKFAGRQAPV
ncbi:putative NADH dehydrogenase (ubiquinone) complex I, assembly factor 6 like protein [Fusarium oxysporum f. sp. albedinis]|nr:putative NADH dehydrogenase (ubiquinone) complex I, assembly factor 6 like protein [Fusarium oxysporum f. sp. albedinis]